MDEDQSDAGDARLHSADVLDKDVFDLNGHRLGHVNLAREDSNGLLSFDVTLRPREQRALGVESNVITVPWVDVEATDFHVTLAEDGVHLAHPGLALPPEIAPD